MRECISSEWCSSVLTGGGSSTSSEKVIDIIGQDLVLFILISMLLELALGAGKGTLESVSSRGFVRGFLGGVICLVVLFHRLDNTMPLGACSGWRGRRSGA